jgi:hypothetical protein
MSRIYHTDLKRPSNSSVVRLFRNLSAVRITRVLGIFLRYMPLKVMRNVSESQWNITRTSDAEILHFRDEVESHGRRGDEWPERPGNLQATNKARVRESMPRITLLQKKKTRHTGVGHLRKPRKLMV